MTQSDASDPWSPTAHRERQERNLHHAHEAARSLEAEDRIDFLRTMLAILASHTSEFHWRHMVNVAEEQIVGREEEFDYPNMPE